MCFNCIGISAAPSKNVAHQKKDVNKKEQEKLDEINDTLDKLAELSISTESNNESVSIRSYDDTKDECEKLEEKLEELGVKELTNDEISAKFSTVSARVAVPPTTAYTKWYSYTYNWTYNNEKFTVQHLYAQAKKNGSKLYQTGTRTLYSNKEYALNSKINMASTIVDFGTGFIPSSISNFIPFSDIINDSVLDGMRPEKGERHVITYNMIETACFSYVKEYGKSDSWQELSFSSNSVMLEVKNAITVILSNGDSRMLKDTSKYDVTKTYRAKKYASTEDAIKRFVNVSNPSYSFVDRIKYTGIKSNEYTILYTKSYTSGSAITK